MASSPNAVGKPELTFAESESLHFVVKPKETLGRHPFRKEGRGKSSPRIQPASPKPTVLSAASQPLQSSLAAEQSRVARQVEFQSVNLSSSSSADFIDDYVRYANVIEAPAEMHEGVALSIVAATLNYNGVTIPNGSACSPLDVWYVLLTPSGGGRNTTVRTASKILDRAGMGFLLRTDAWGSPQAMYQEFALNPRGFRIWGEMSEKLKELADSRSGNAKAWLTDRYDEFRHPDNRTYRKTGREDHDGNSLDTPDIEFSEAPRTNFLATSSEAWFFQNLSKGDSTGGFVPRWMIAKAKSTGILIPTPSAFDERLLDPLASKLREIARLEGEADLSEILPEYDRWYRETYSRFKDQPNSALAIPSWNRHRVHVLKLAVIYEASSSGTLKVSVRSWKRAAAKAKELEETIFGYLDTDMSGEGYKLKQMEERVREAGNEGLPKHKFTSAFKTDPFREQKLHTLVDAQTVIPFELPSQGGRPGVVLVHAAFEKGFNDGFRSANGGKAPTQTGLKKTNGK